MIDTKLEQIKLLVRSNEKILDLLFLRQRNLTACWQSMVTIAGSKKELKAQKMMLWLQINLHKAKRPLLVKAVYHPSSTTTAIDTTLELNIGAEYLRKQEMYFLGDFNINYLDTTTYQNHRLIRALKSLNLSQVISSVTRP